MELDEGIVDAEESAKDFSSALSAFKSLNSITEIFDAGKIVSFEDVSELLSTYPELIKMFGNLTQDQQAALLGGVRQQQREVMRSALFGMISESDVMMQVVKDSGMDISAYIENIMDNIVNHSGE